LLLRITNCYKLEQSLFMKKLLLVFLLGLLSASIFGQAAPENSNTIILSASDSVQAKTTILKVLESRGYKIKVNPKTPNTITTVPKTLKENTRLSVTATIEGPEVILSGNLSIAGQSGMRVENKGKKGTPILTAWDEMEKIAKAMGGPAKFEIR
jgi:hypothetical protein